MLRHPTGAVNQLRVYRDRDAALRYSTSSETIEHLRQSPQGVERRVNALAAVQRHQRETDYGGIKPLKH